MFPGSTGPQGPSAAALSDYGRQCLAKSGAFVQGNVLEHGTPINLAGVVAVGRCCKAS